MVFLFILINSGPIWDNILKFWTNQNSKMADKDGRHSEMIT